MPIIIFTVKLQQIHQICLDTAAMLNSVKWNGSLIGTDLFIHVGLKKKRNIKKKH